jgi:uncharacterized protein DUF1918
VPAKKTTASGTKGKKTLTKNGTARKSATKKATARKATARKSTIGRATAKKRTTRKAPGKGTPRTSGRSATPVSSTRATPARRGDLIVIDSVHVGSPAREGEVLKVIHGELSVSYQVKWGDGHETLITPVAGTAHIVRM